MKQEFHLNLRNVKRENVRRTSILMNNSCIPSYVVCDYYRYKFCFHMEALNGVISLSAKFKNLNNIRRILLFLYIAHTSLNYIFRALSAVMTKSSHSFHLYGPWGCWWGQNFVDGKIVRKCFLSYLSDRNENKQSQWFCVYLAFSCSAVVCFKHIIIISGFFLQDLQ